MATAFVGGGGVGVRLLQVRASFVRVRGRNESRFVICARAGGGAASRRRRLAHNADGPLYVDERCIDCDTCRWMAPKTFGRVEGQSSVMQQPKDPAERHAAFRAAAACPTSSIRIDPPRSKLETSELRAAAESFPFEFSPSELPGVFHLGNADEASFAACAYLVSHNQLPDSHPYMFDTPRFSSSLAKRVVKASGGRAPKWLVLSHKDDVGSHARWAQELGMQRVMHVDDVSKRQGTTECELLLSGGGPWELQDGVEIIGVPGHTRGSIAVLDHHVGALFTGDHLAYSAQREDLSGFPAYNKFSWDEQLRSVEKLQRLPFHHILPAHGRAWHFQSDSDRETQLEAFVTRSRSRS